MLGPEELYLLEITGNNKFSNGTVTCLKMPDLGKTERITFRNNSDMLLCNENGIIFQVAKVKTNGKSNANSNGKK